MENFIFITISSANNIIVRDTDYYNVNSTIDITSNKKMSFQKIKGKGKSGKVTLAYIFAP